MQGESVVVTGVLRLSRWVWRRPSRYCMIQHDDLGRAITTCYVLGDDRELERRLDSRVTICGKAYWIQGVRHKVVVVAD